MEPSRNRFARVPRLDQVSPAPRRPSPAARKLVLAYQGTQAALRIAAFVFVATGVVLTVILGWGLPVDAVIAATCRTTTAEVVSGELEQHVRIRGRHPFRVVYAFEAAGASWQGDQLSRIAPGPTVEVEYASVAPRWSRVAGSTYGWFGWWGLAPLGVVALGIWGLAQVVRSNRREIRAYVHGRPVLATVTFRGEDPTVELNRRHPYVIRWEFRGPDGQPVTGSISSMDPADLEPFAAAEQLVVLYDPADPRANTLYVG